MVTIKVQFLLIAFLLLSSSYNIATATEDAGTKAYQIYSLAQYVSWPSSNEPLTFCVLGASDVAEILKKTIAGKKIAKRELQMGATGCHVLFGSTSTSKGMLTISDGKGCSGAIFDFYKENGKLEFSYNKAANNRSGLNISAQALKLAKKQC